MAISYHWTINQLDAKIEQDGLQNVIYTIHWEYRAIDDSDTEQPITSNAVGSQLIHYNVGDTFIPYDELTKEDVVGWLVNLLDVDALQSNLESQINKIKNPVDEYLHPNWD